MASVSSHSGDGFGVTPSETCLTLVFGVFLFLALYGIIWTTGPLWWLVAAIGFFAFSILLGQLAPVLILPLFYEIKRLDDSTLTTRLSNLTEGTGLSIQGVYRMDMSRETKKANAMLAGLGKTRRVILGDTLIDGFSSDEIEIIFAHEIGHHVHRHIWKMIVAGIVFSVVSFLLCDLALRSFVQAQEAAFAYAQLPASSLPLLMLCLTLLSILFEPLQNMVSRHFERQADTYALSSTNLTEAYRSAFRKSAQLNKEDPNPHPLEVFLFHSHPAISERLALADRIEG